MKKLYCPECGNYLEGGDGDMHDCCCGWKQPDEAESTEIIADFDVEAVAWAYGKCVALGLENGSMESAMMMDRLKMMLGGY